jgi:hypothetical protein
MTAPRIATPAPVKTTPARASDRSGGSSATGRAPHYRHTTILERF